jgi:hypothetical protein
MERCLNTRQEVSFDSKLPFVHVRFGAAKSDCLPSIGAMLATVGSVSGASTHMT